MTLVLVTTAPFTQAKLTIHGPPFSQGIEQALGHIQMVAIAEVAGPGGL